jgi:protein SFI1
MEYRAAKHVARQDGVLLRAIVRVWKARERGKLLERVRTMRLIKETWAVWKRRLQSQHHRDSKLPEIRTLECVLTSVRCVDVAVAFFLRSKTGAAASALHRWRQNYASHQNAKSFAVQYHSAQLRYKILLSWRIQLRDKLKLMRMARVACQFFVARRAWKAWGNALKVKVREKQVKEMERRRVTKIFHRESRRNSVARYS